ncbi:MAG TPA: MFS transporter, partial [Phototrophicaceae bacterium]|nr:MFS transporter [Phototrophicaceae bacterium]
MTTLSQADTGLQTNTLAALRYPNFRLYFVGQLISLSGSWMQIIAQGWLVFQLTQSELWLGLVSCAAGIPALVLSPFAGVLVDRFPRRRILLFTQTAQMALALTLSVLTFTGLVQVYHVLILAFLLGITNALDAPSRQTIIIDLVGHDDLTSGIALNSIIFNGSRAIGPAVAGIVLTQVGPAWCFFFNGLSFLAVIFMLLIMQMQPIIKPTGRLAPIRRLKEGLWFSRRHPTIAPILLLAVAASLFTGNLMTLFPAFADTVLKSPAEGYATMSTAFGLGAVGAGALMTVLGKRFGRGPVITAMIVIVTLLSPLISRLTTIESAAAFAVIFGFVLILQLVTMNTLLQSVVPDEFRGRVLSLYTLTFFGVAPFGALGLGALASVIGTPAAMTIYALAGGL